MKLSYVIIVIYIYKLKECGTYVSTYQLFYHPVRGRGLCPSHCVGSVKWSLSHVSGLTMVGHWGGGGGLSMGLY